MPHDSRPNVLLILTDQQRWDTIAAAGFSHMQTPNLDAIAADGAVFSDAFCNSPVCMPSRMSLLSGQYPSALGCTCNGIEFPRDVPCLQHWLGAAGYTTGNYGKLHFTNHASRDHAAPHFAYGFDELVLSDEPGCYEDDYIAWVRERDPAVVEQCRCSTPPAWRGDPIDTWPRETYEPYDFAGPEDLTHSAFVADRTGDAIRRHAGAPWFFIAGFYAPHTPVNPPKRFADLYDPEKLPLPQMNEGENRHGLSPQEWLRVRQYYYGLVSHVDDQIGRILAVLDETGQRENTLIVFTSDHGEHLGDHGWVQKGPPGHESCTHVPLLVSWRGQIAAEAPRSGLVELVDVVPTVLDACNIEIPGAAQGRSLWPWLQGGYSAARASAYGEHRVPGRDDWRMLRTPEYRYCWCDSGEELLYDLAADPFELVDVSTDPKHAEAKAMMRSELLRRCIESSRRDRSKIGDY